MAKQTINIGTTPNDGLGDTVRDSFDICNDNFTEVYDANTAHATSTSNPHSVTAAQVSALALAGGEMSGI